MASRSPNTETSSWLKHEEYIRALREQAARFSEVLRRSPSDAPVPSCPGWTALDLVRHVVQVYAHKAAVLRAAGEAVAGGDVEAAAQVAFPLALERHDAVVTDLAALLAELDPRSLAWTWMEGAGESTVGAWARRMAHEAMVHRIDAELTAGGQVSRVDDALAIDGINEVLTWMAGDPDIVVSNEAAAGAPGTVLLDYGSGSWLVELGPGTHLVTAAESNRVADVRISASPMALDLLLWGRPSPVSWPEAAVVDRLRARIAKSLA
ncbi:maleylpyruvate isomerase N-terminal domain-containing protein [Nocardia sp. NPDC050710]|uniref:maleylpyruvate isomerase N-terminal domain-containing protein n=1 Tax=Nocardia sp. NPDC050710 TaxID=3157220 RepID=UPI0033C955AB